MMNEHNDKVFSLLVHKQSAVDGMQIKPALNIVNERYVPWHLHAEHPIVPYLCRLCEVVIFTAEYQQITQIAPLQRVNEAFPSAFREFLSV